MTVENVSPLPKLRFVDNNGNALSGGLLFTYSAGTTSKLTTYTDSTGGTPNANPIILDTRGECNCWLPPGTAYKFTLAPATDTDPPTNPIWTVDQLTTGLAQIPFGPDAGTANTYSVTGVAGISASPSAGNCIVVKILHPNTGASTLAVNGGSAKSITDQGGNALVASALAASQCAFMTFDGTAWQYNYLSYNILQNPNISSTRITEGGPCFSLIVAQGTTTHNSDVVELAGNFGLTANTGSGTGHENVTLYAGTLVQAGAGDSYGVETSLTLAAGATEAFALNAFGAEVLFTNNDRDLPISGANGTGTGLRISGSPSAGCTSTFGILLLNGTIGTSLFHVGLAFEPGTAKDYAILENSNATVGFALFGGAAQAYKIDCSPLSAAVGTNAYDMRLANSKGIVGRNAANSADITVLTLDSNNSVVIGQASTGLIVSQTTFVPSIDNSFSCGDSTHRWTAVWAANGTIQTSDPRLKTDIAALPEAMPIVMGINPVTFKWIDGGQDKPGKRTHWGFLAPDIKAQSERIGMDWGAYVEAEDGIEGLRVDQLVPVLWKALQEANERISTLEKKLEA